MQGSGQINLEYPGYGSRDYVKNPIPMATGDTLRAATQLQHKINEEKISGEDVEVKNVDISKLKTIQPTVNKNAVVNPSSDHESSSSLPFVANVNGEFVVLDGNHRISRAMYNGKKRIRVHFYNGSEMKLEPFNPFV